MSHDALRTILPVAGWREDRVRAVAITGDADPILPTSFRIGETSAAALAAVGLAVSDLWELRTGRRQEVAVDVRRATASLVMATARARSSRQPATGRIVRSASWLMARLLRHSNSERSTASPIAR